MLAKPPIRCTPCRVTYKQLSPPELAGIRFQIDSTGRVWEIVSGQTVSETNAALVRREAGRQRRNRNARERNQAMPAWE